MILKLKLTIIHTFLIGTLLAHPWKPAHYIIVDTDGGLDDLRAISMLLASTDIRVLAITTSNGVLDAETAYIKVKSLLKGTYHEGVLTGVNNSSSVKVKNCKTAITQSWGPEIEHEISMLNAVEVVNYIFKHSDVPITFVSLGSLNTVKMCYKELSGLKERITKIIWSCTSPGNKPDFNYSIDPDSYNWFLEQNISITKVDNRCPELIYDDKLVETLSSIKNVFSDPYVNSILETKSDFAKSPGVELLSLYLHYPDYFSPDTSDIFSVNRSNPVFIYDSVPEALDHILNGETQKQQQVLESFPTDKSAYQVDIREIIDVTIDKYGHDEWISCVLTNELHRHLGIYASIGAKMGTRAKEYFGTGVDEMEIITYAGTTPPFSCMNDGLQVSTGGTLGHGLISVDSEDLKLPKAKFTYMDRSITISLKDEYRKKIESQIKELVIIHGLDSNIYWELVRKAAISYWANWDRHEIFDIMVIQDIQ